MSNPEYLVRHDNGRIFAYTKALAARADMVQAMDLDEAQKMSAKRSGVEAPKEPENDGDFVISQANKDELAEFAKTEYGVDLDKRKKVDDLRTEVAELAQGQ